MVDERIHVAGADPEEESRLAELPPRFAAVPVGLAQYGDAEAGLFQHARQDRHREAGVIDIGVAGHEYDVNGIPSAGAHLVSGHRREGGGETFAPQG